MKSCSRYVAVLHIFALVIVACNAQSVSVIELMLEGEPFSSDEFDVGRYALMFMVPDECSACETSLPWLQHAAEAFPEIRFLLVSPVPLPEACSEWISVLIDSEGRLGGAFGIDRVPEISLLVEGVRVKEVDWPFTEGGLFRACAESLLIEILRPDPRTLLGEVAPAIDAVKLDGVEVSIVELQGPQLLVFFRVGCSTCWETLEPLGELSAELPVVLIAMSSSDAGISDSDREKLRRFEQAAGLTVILGYGAQIPQDYNLAISPTFCLVDSAGLVAEIWEEELNRVTLSERLLTLSRGKASD